MTFLALILVAVAAYCYGWYRGLRRGYREAADLHFWLAERREVSRVEREFENLN